MHLVVTDEFGNKLNVRVKKLDGNGGCHALKDTPHSAAGSSLFALQEVHIRAANFEFDVWRYDPPKSGDSGPKKKPTNGAPQIQSIMLHLCVFAYAHQLVTCVCLRFKLSLSLSLYRSLTPSLSLSLYIYIYIYNI